ncbi:MAG: hypothetical protein HFI36_02720 [Bacilli bacterium]|jgi:hypothetical protein|nr:hypothetical protein [Bacilli bacterium]
MKYLKIKDNVDLKELEKFGFKNESNYNRGELYTRPINESDLTGIAINFERKISFMFPYSREEFPPIENYINDLIKVDIVEVVDE